MANGVKLDMYRTVVCLLLASGIRAQAPAQPPLETAMQAYRRAQQSGRLEEAAARRDEARRLLQQVPVIDPALERWANQVSQMYQNGGMTVQARAVLQDVLARAGALGDTDPLRVELLSSLAGLWEQDGNLLKAATYREQAVAALEAAPPADSGTPRAVAMPGSYSRYAAFVIDRQPHPDFYAYQALAEIYRRLGRPDDVARIQAKMLARAANRDGVLAQLYEQEGQLDKAAEIYKRQAEQAADPRQQANALQSLANLYQRQQRTSDAIAALQQAIGILKAAGQPESQNQSIWMRQQVAQFLNQAGQTQAADQVYTQLLSETPEGQDRMQLQILNAYANHLAQSKRGEQAESLLKDYLANHSNLQPWEENNLLFSLAHAARAAGHVERAEEYEKTARQKVQPPRAALPDTVSIMQDLQKAQSAGSANHPDEAFRLAMEALDAAPRAADRQQVGWTIPTIAIMLASQGLPDKADQLYQRLFGLVETWSLETLQPLSTVEQQYARFLIQQKRWGEVAAAIDRYRNTAVTAHGAESSAAGDALRLTIEAERAHGSPERALAQAQDLLALEQSLSGSTSEPYLRTSQTVADLLEFTGDVAHSLDLRRKAVAITDLVFRDNDPQRGFTRIQTAQALARARQFDEAEQLANEAVAVSLRMQPPQPKMFTNQVEQIRRMRMAPEGQPGPNVQNPDGSRRMRWFSIASSKPDAEIQPGK